MIGENELRSRQVFILGLIGVTLIAAGLRLYRLDAGSFWLDELYTVAGTAEMDTMHRSKALGYVPTWMGLRLAGIDPAAIPADEPERWREMGITEGVARMPTALMGILTVPVLGLAAVRLFGWRVALLAALFLAVAPWHIYWSQAARFYTPQFLFYSLSLVLYLTATRRGSRAAFAAAMGCLFLAFLSQPTALVLLGVFAIDWAVALLRGRPLRFGPFEWGVGAATVLACGVLLLRDITAAPEDWTHFVTEVRRHQSPVPMLMGAAYIIGPVVVAVAAVCAVGMWRRHAREAVALAAGAALPILAFAMLSAWAFVGLRYAFISLFPWLLLAAWGAERMHRALRTQCGRVMASAPALAVVAAMALSNAIYFRSEGNFHARWRDAVEYVAAHRDPADLVFATEVMLARYYLQDGAVHPLPQSIEAAAAVEQPAWFVAEVTHSGRRTGRFWLLPHAELRDYFSLRAVHANSSVQVYRHDPDRAERHPNAKNRTD